MITVVALMISVFLVLYVCARIVVTVTVLVAMLIILCMVMVVVVILSMLLALFVYASIVMAVLVLMIVLFRVMVVTVAVAMMVTVVILGICFFRFWNRCRFVVVFAPNRHVQSSNRSHSSPPDTLGPNLELVGQFGHPVFQTICHMSLEVLGILGSIET